jgi:Flp pilus assembly protein TadB
VSEADHPVPAPPAGEELHLPGPSLLPFLAAIAITLIVVGTTISTILSIVGVVALVIVVIRWVADTRRDVGELPESHH